MSEKRSIPNKIFLTTNIVAVILLFCCYLAGIINPVRFWPIAFFSLLYPTILLINIGFITLWIAKGNKEFLISLIAILIGWTTFHANFNLNFKEIPEDSKSIKVLTYNVKNFDLYNWKKGGETKDKIFEFLKEQNADILCFQEYFHSTHHKGFETNSDLKKLLKSKDIHTFFTETHKRGDNWGMAIYSKYPIIKKQDIRFKGLKHNTCIMADIVIRKDTIRVINVHLASIGLGDKTTNFNKINDKDWKEEDLDIALSISKKLKSAFQKRGEQVDKIAQLIKNSPYPVLVCGDFNDTPASYSYKKLADGLTDAFIESGNGFGNTYNGNYPSFRIDYILHHPKFKSYNFKTHKKDLSDHYAISCLMQLN